MIAILDSLTGGEVVLILLVALLVLGPERLPETARTLGQWAAKLRSMTSTLQGEVREVLDDPAMQPIREMGEFVASPRKKLMELATSAEAEAEEARRVADEAAAAAAAAEEAAGRAREIAAEAELVQRADELEREHQLRERADAHEHAVLASELAVLASELAVLASEPADELAETNAPS